MSQYLVNEGELIVGIVQSVVMPQLDERDIYLPSYKIQDIVISGESMTQIRHDVRRLIVSQLLAQ